MKKTISIRICTGTTCYVMGASDLLTLEDHIPEHLKAPVSISGSTCLGMCKYIPGISKSDTEQKPPFVEINGKIMGQATIKKVIEAAQAEFTGADYAYNK